MRAVRRLPVGEGAAVAEARSGIDAADGRIVSVYLHLVDAPVPLGC